MLMFAVHISARILAPLCIFHNGKDAMQLDEEPQY